MLPWLAQRVTKNTWVVIFTWILLALILITGAFTGFGHKNLFARLHTDSATINGTESAQGEQIISTLTGDGQTVTLLITGIEVSIANQQTIADALDNAHKDLGLLVGDENVLDPFVVPGMLEQSAGQVLTASSGNGFLMVISVDPNGDEVASATDKTYADKVAQLVTKVEARLSEIPAELKSIDSSVSGIVSDEKLLSTAVSTQVKTDLIHGALICIPLLIIFMIFAFSNIFSAILSICGSLLVLACSLGGLWIFSIVTDLQSLVVNVVTIVSLGLAINYSILMTARYREECAHLQSLPTSEPAAKHRSRRAQRRNKVTSQAMRATFVSTGRTVLFSGSALIIAMLFLMLTGTTVLRSLALSIIVTTFASVALALTLIPALLIVCGKHIKSSITVKNKKIASLWAKHTQRLRSQRGVFAVITALVQRFPGLILISCLAFLIILAAPAHNLHLLNSTDALLAQNSPQRTYFQVLQKDFPAARQQEATLIIAQTGDSTNNFINEQVAKTTGVDKIISVNTAGQYTVVYLDLAGDGTDAASEAAVTALRELKPPADTWITGQAASQVDFNQTIDSRLPWVLPIIILATLVLVFLMTGSAIMPLKALFVTGISLSASAGIVTWSFQSGHLAKILNFTPPGGIESYVLVSGIVLGFGLVINYELFIFARIKECWEKTRDHNLAVQQGLQLSGRTITSMLGVMLVIFIGFIFSDLLMQQIVFTLTVIIVLDATIIRLLLTPATMSLLGKWVWWRPQILQNIYSRYGFHHFKKKFLAENSEPPIKH